MESLTDVLRHYGIVGEVTAVHEGPLVKQIEFLPEAGTKLKTVSASLPDIARELKVSSLRVEPVEGSDTLGFEIPADEFKTVDFAALLASPDFENAKGALPLCLGVDITGRPVIADLAKMPHLLIGGTTGSGKSVGLNTFILSLIAKKLPSMLKLVLIDPKRIEFAVYNNQKYMYCPVVTDNAEAAAVLAQLVTEMERRYDELAANMVKNITEYNERGGKMPYIVCVIDEFADLMAADKSVGLSVQRLAQKARACGIHLILATQRPSVDVVTGVLKANFPTRLAYKVAGAADSRTILDTGGAENLIGCGDALFLSADGMLKRIHGAYMPDEEIAAMLEPFRAEVKPLKLAVSEEKEETKPAAGKSKSGFWRGLLDFWSSLRQREKKTIIAGLAYVVNLFIGSVKKKK
ncbi:MAG: DNA translocase FtsK [Alphaproteobacteria bacterium]|nr:DNA translocase FtsK [Alphaproteobacteria bacterium]